MRFLTVRSKRTCYLLVDALADNKSNELIYVAATHSFSFWLLKSFWKPQSTEYHFPDVTDKIVCMAKLVHLEACTFPGMSGEASCINKITPTYNAWLLFSPYKWNPEKSIFLHRMYGPVTHTIFHYQKLLRSTCNKLHWSWQRYFSNCSWNGQYF